MKLIRTQTVPRRLINTVDGRDVTASTLLVYPYLDVATQTRNLGTVSIVRRDNGQLVKRILRNRASATVLAPVISSRSAPAVQLNQLQPRRNMFRWAPKTNNTARKQLPSISNVWVCLFVSVNTHEVAQPIVW